MLNAKRVVAFVPGAGGGYYSPAGGLYYHLMPHLAQAGIASMQVRYRQPAVLSESVFDLLAGISYLESVGSSSVGVVGHSFGGAVVIQAAANAEVVRTCVPLSTQTYGVEPARLLAPRCSLLLLHGQADTVLAYSCSQYVYSIAGEPKKLLLYPGVGHSLDEAAKEVLAVVGGWLLEQLPAETS